MIMKYIFVIGMFLSVYACQQTSDKVEMLAPGTISTDLYEFGGSFSPDGELVLFTLSSPNYYIQEYTILYTERLQKKWSQPEVVSFSGSYSDRDPHFSSDGQYVYFASKRPVNEGEVKEDFDIWRIPFLVDDSRFGEAEHLSFNTPATEITPALDAKNNLFFSSFRPGDNHGSLDIYVSDFADGKFQDPVNLGLGVNSSSAEAYPFACDNKLLYSSRRSGGFGDFDIYVAERRVQGWVAKLVLDSLVNSSYQDVAPMVRSGQLYFSSTRQPESLILTSVEDWDSLQSSLLNGQSNIYYFDHWP